MGSVHVEDAATNGDAISYFKLAGLEAPDDLVSPSSLRDDVLLAAWLITLIRTREERSATFDWAYDSPQHSRRDSRLSTDDVLPGLNLETTVGDLTKAVAQHIAPGRSERAATTNSRTDSIVLSTGPLSRDVDTSADDVSPPGDAPNTHSSVSISQQSANRDIKITGRITS